MTFATGFEPVFSRQRRSAWRQAARAVVAFCHGLPVQPLSLRPEDDRYFDTRTRVLSGRILCSVTHPRLSRPRPPAQP